MSRAPKLWGTPASQAADICNTMIRLGNERIKDANTAAWVRAQAAADQAHPYLPVARSPEERLRASERRHAGLLALTLVIMVPLVLGTILAVIVNLAS